MAIESAVVGRGRGTSAAISVPANESSSLDRAGLAESSPPIGAVLSSVCRPASAVWTAEGSDPSRRFHKNPAATATVSETATAPTTASFRCDGVA
jgi:hypothetical protein